MKRRPQLVQAACAIAIACTSPTLLVAADQVQVCDRKFARQTIATGNFEAFCDCRAVSTSLIRATQRNKNFAEILSVTSKACPGVAGVLSEITTASIPRNPAPGGNDGGDNPGDGGGNPGGSGGDPGGGGGDPGGGGGDPGGGGGDPGGGGGDPGGGGGDPGGGGGDPGGGGGDPGGGGGDPGGGGGDVDNGW